MDYDYYNIQVRFTDNPDAPEGNFDFWTSWGSQYTTLSEAKTAVRNYQARMKNTAVKPTCFRIIGTGTRIVDVFYD